MYKVYIEKSAQKEIKKIPIEDLQKILEEIKKLSINPRPNGCRKLSVSKDDWRIRIGNYRVVYEIDDKWNIHKYYNTGVMHFGSKQIILCHSHNRLITHISV
jgi:mRNA interferase RelE/StbE